MLSQAGNGEWPLGGLLPKWKRPAWTDNENLESNHTKRPHLQDLLIPISSSNQTNPKFLAGSEPPMTLQHAWSWWKRKPFISPKRGNESRSNLGVCHLAQGPLSGAMKMSQSPPGLAVANPKVQHLISQIKTFLCLILYEIAKAL